MYSLEIYCEKLRERFLSCFSFLFFAQKPKSLSDITGFRAFKNALIAIIIARSAVQAGTTFNFNLIDDG